MRVAVVSERARGRGASEASWNLAAALRDAGHDVAYCYAEPSVDAEDAFEHARQFGSWQRATGAISAMRRLQPGTRRWFDEHLVRREELAAMRRSLLEMVDEFEPHLVHVHNVGAVGGHVLVSSLRRRRPTLWTAHDRYPFELFHNRWSIDGEETTTWEFSPSGRPADVGFEMFRALPLEVPILTPSRWLADIAADRLRSSRHPVEVIPNLIPVAEGSRRTPLADSLRVDCVALAVITQPDYALKGFAVAREAVRIARSGELGRTADVALVVVTPKRLRLVGESIYGLHELHRTGIVDRVGYLDRGELASLYAAADVLVLPSYVENMPNVVIEAAAAGLPTIGSRVGGVPEVVRDGETGWLFDAGDARGLAEALVQAASDREERERRGDAALREYEERYHPDRVLGAHLAAYEAATESPSNRHCYDVAEPIRDLSATRYSPRREHPRGAALTRRLRRRIGAAARRLRLLA